MQSPFLDQMAAPLPGAAICELALKLDQHKQHATWLQEVRAAMALIQDCQPGASYGEVWAQLSVVAGRSASWQLAAKCADAALQALPAGVAGLANQSWGGRRSIGSEIGSIGRRECFWAGVAELQLCRVRSMRALTDHPHLIGILCTVSSLSLSDAPARSFTSHFAGSV
jgi:hypothetical protein